MERGRHLTLPREVTVGDRRTQGQRLDLLPCPGEIDEIGSRDRRHAKAALVFDRDQTLGCEPAARFAERGTPHVVRRREVLETQLLTRREPPVHDIGAETVEGSWRLTVDGARDAEPRTPLVCRQNT